MSGLCLPIIANEELLVCAFKSNEKVSKDLRSYIITTWHQRCHTNAVADIILKAIHKQLMGEPAVC